MTTKKISSVLNPYKNIIINNAIINSMADGHVKKSLQADFDCFDIIFDDEAANRLINSESDYFNKNLPNSMTMIEQRWLKTMLYQPDITLFLEDSLVKKLKAKLTAVEGFEDGAEKTQNSINLLRIKKLKNVVLDSIAQKKHLSSKATTVDKWFTLIF